MARIDELIAQRIEARLEAKLSDLDSVIDSLLEKALENALARVLGVEAEAPKRTRTRKGEVEAKAEVEVEAKAEVEGADALLARLERAASRLGEHYGPMLLRRARSISRHAVNPHGAMAVLVAWAERTAAEEVVAVLRGSERLSGGTTLSGWRLMAARLGIPVRE